jgi:sterol desaturase/sphingolipid hydroxylase (fatty acid hydroxylase superfamily)
VIRPDGVAGDLGVDRGHRRRRGPRPRDEAIDLGAELRLGRALGGRRPAQRGAHIDGLGGASDPRRGDDEPDRERAQGSGSGTREHGRHRRAPLSASPLARDVRAWIARRSAPIALTPKPELTDPGAAPPRRSRPACGTKSMISTWLLRSAISGAFAIVLYLVSAGVVARFWNRGVARSVVKHDFKLGIISLVFGSPVIQGFAMTSERYGIGRMYNDIGERGWLYWIISLPLYILCWDAVFYVTHLVLHIPYVYRKSHFRHHSCRPPVPWSGIAIDPFETILSGILPYTVPLFIFPFHLTTVYALNILLMVWATLVHSSFNWSGNAIMLSPQDHNLHHAFGLKNSNFAAVFTFWDRLGSTLNRRQTPPWWGKESWSPRGVVASAVPSTDETFVPLPDPPPNP